MKRIHVALLPLLLTSLLACAALSQQATTARSAAPNVARLKEHVSYLASPELEGRRPGTPGAEKAAIYIASEFARLGLGCPEPKGTCRHTSNNHLGYLKEFPFVAGVEAGKNNALGFTRDGKSNAVALGEEWMPLGFSANGGVKGAQIVFVGHGITAAELKHDDYAHADVKGKIAVAFAGTPDGDNPHGQFARYADTRWKAIAAKDKGAAALVVIAGEEKFTNDRRSKLRYDQASGEAPLPVIAVSRQIAARWFGLSDASQLSALEKAKEKWADAAQKFTGVAVNLAVEVTRRSVPAHNVVAVLEGSDPQLKREFIVIGAHYDHLGRGGHDGSLAPNAADAHLGADDNASGTAALLELARLFSANRSQLRRSLVFVAFSAEESGLLGSKAYVNNPPFPLADTVAMLNLDMVGRLREGRLSGGGVGTSPEFRQIIEAANGGRLTLRLNEDGFGPSDHASFYAKQIPVLFFFTGSHEDYHKPSDTAEKINYEGQAQVVAFVADIVRALDRQTARPAYAATRGEAGGRSTGFRVYLGTVPSYAESNDGLALDAVRDDSPAKKAGLQAGDKIVRLAGREIKNVYDYTYALGEMQPDREYEVEVVRGGKRLKLKIAPQARR